VFFFIDRDSITNPCWVDICGEFDDMSRSDFKSVSAFDGRVNSGMNPPGHACNKRPGQKSGVDLGVDLFSGGVSVTTVVQHLSPDFRRGF